MQTLEHKVMYEIMLECGKRNWIAVRVNCGGGLLANGSYFTACNINGYPDLTIITDKGQIIFCECKAGKGKLREDQKLFLTELEKRGCNVIVCYSKEEFIKKVEDFN